MVQFSHHDYQSEDLPDSQEPIILAGEILTALLISSTKAHVRWVALKDNFKLCHKISIGGF